MTEPLSVPKPGDRRLRNCVVSSGVKTDGSQDSYLFRVLYSVGVMPQCFLKNAEKCWGDLKPHE